MLANPILLALALSVAAFPQSTTWTFDNIHRIGGHSTEVLGDPKVIDTPLGKAILFDGKDDAIYVPSHPLADAPTFTWEAIFRPDGGAFEQRWFHLAEQASGADTGNRMLFEIRVTNGHWYLDSFAATKTGAKALLNKDHLHPVGQWYHVASVYDGKTFRNYVNGKLENSADVQFAPQSNGRTSIGVRINKVNYFQGAVHLSRFTKRALAPSEFLQSPTAANTDWPRFRGPNGAGIADGAPLPAQLTTQNIAWKAPVPFGQSSPILAAGKVFTTALEGNTLLTIAHDAATGSELWRKTLPRTHVHEIYKSNDPASSTPAAGNDAIYIFFPDFGLVSYTFDGRERWRHPLGPFRSFYGMATSPILAGDLVILLCDQTTGSYLLALDKNTGRQRWRTPRPEHKEGWSVPIVDNDQLITIGSTRLESYFLSTGEPRWWMPISSHGAMGTPLLHNGNLLLSTSGSNEPWLPTFAAVLAKVDKNKDGKVSVEESATEQDWAEHFGWVDRDGDKFLTSAEWDEARSLGIGQYGAISLPLAGKGQRDPASVHWRFQRNIPYIPAPLLYNGVFYMVKSGGIVTSLDPATGQLLKQGRTQNAPGEYFASPVAGDGKIYIVSNEGKLSVLKAGPDWEVLSVHDLGEDAFATPAIANGRIYVRTRGTLYCFTAPR